MLMTALVKLLQSLKTAKGAKYRSSSSDSSKIAVVVVRNKDGFAPCRMKDVCSALSALYKLDSVNQLSTQPGSCSSLEVCETCLLAHELNCAWNGRVNSIEWEYPLRTYKLYSAYINWRIVSRKKWKIRTCIQNWIYHQRKWR